MNKSRIINFKSFNPRRNLNPSVAKKRGESNFLGAFERKFVESCERSGFCGRNFSVAGYGIADFIWIEWKEKPSLNIKSFNSKRETNPFLNNKITAFEMKLKDWRKALQQAYRYTYYADKAVVVLPPDTVNIAKQELNLFKQFNIGLWSFNKEKGKFSIS